MVTSLRYIDERGRRLVLITRLRTAADLEDERRTSMKRGMKMTLSATSQTLTNKSPTSTQWLPLRRLTGRKLSGGINGPPSHEHQQGQKEEDETTTTTTTTTTRTSKALLRNNLPTPPRRMIACACGVRASGEGPEAAALCAALSCSDFPSRRSLRAKTRAGKEETPGR